MTKCGGALELCPHPSPPFICSQQMLPSREGHTCWGQGQDVVTGLISRGWCSQPVNWEMSSPEGSLTQSWQDKRVLPCALYEPS